MSFVFLKIKIKALAAEAAIIKREKRRLPRRLKEARLKNWGPDAWELRQALAAHHKGDMRGAARSALLAYAFLRGKAYNSVEEDPRWRRPVPSRPGPDWTRVRQNVLTFSDVGWGKERTTWGKPIPYAERRATRSANVDSLLLKWRDGEKG